MDHRTFHVFGTGGMVTLAVVILTLFTWNFRKCVCGLLKSVADFKKAHDDFENRHGQ